MTALLFRKSVAALFVCLTLIPAPLMAQRKTNEAEHQLFDRLNRERASQGLPRLKWDDALAGAARQHSDAMAARNTLSHQLPGEPTLPARVGKAGVEFISLSENVAQGPTVANIDEQWRNSPAHRANVLDTDVDTVGVGIAERDGVLFATADFCKAAKR